MPRTIEQGFFDFMPKLVPSQAEVQAGSSHRTSIEACLKANFGLLRFVRIGSLGNGTSIRGFSDVDYLACLPTNSLKTKSYNSLYDVRTALDNRFPNTGVRVNSPAVCVPFGTRASENHEIVIADYVRENNGFKIYEIADGNNGWMEVSPDAHNAYVAAVDKRLNGKVKPFIRYVKAWKYSQNVPISSFYLELRAAKYASTEPSIIYSIDIKNFLKSLWDNQLARMQDPMAYSGYIEPCKTDVLKQDALSKLNTALTRAEKARDAELNQDISGAFSWWNLLFNSNFPSYYL